MLFSIGINILSVEYKAGSIENTGSVAAVVSAVIVPVVPVFRFVLLTLYIIVPQPLSAETNA
jgi:hypothetical protein